MRLKFLLLPGVIVSVVAAGVACQGNKAPTEPTPSCSVTISPAGLAFGSDGGTGSVTVSTAAGCAWTAVSSGGWIAVTTGAAGSGPGTVAYAVTANAAAADRNGSLNIAGQVHAVAQHGRAPAECTYEISPTSATYTHDAADGSLAVSTAAGCSWAATGGTSWLTLTSGDRGTGSGTVSYRVSRNQETADKRVSH